MLNSFNDFLGVPYLVSCNNIVKNIAIWKFHESGNEIFWENKIAQMDLFSIFCYRKLSQMHPKINDSWMFLPYGYWNIIPCFFTIFFYLISHVASLKVKYNVLKVVIEKIYWSVESRRNWEITSVTCLSQDLPSKLTSIRQIF